jgi:hypothetical protein
MTSRSCGGQHRTGPCRMVCLILLGGNLILFPWSSRGPIRGKNPTRRGLASKLNPPDMREGIFIHREQF